MRLWHLIVLTGRARWSLDHDHEVHRIGTYRDKSWRLQTCRSTCKFVFPTTGARMSELAMNRATSTCHSCCLDFCLQVEMLARQLERTILQFVSPASGPQVAWTDLADTWPHSCHLILGVPILRPSSRLRELGPLLPQPCWPGLNPLCFRSVIVVAACAYR